MADGVHVTHDLLSTFGPFHIDYFIVFLSGAQLRLTVFWKARHCVEHLEQLSAACARISSCVRLACSFD
ncbi:MAG: hypothetical protein ACK55Z_31590 [bacterium]